MNKINVKSVFTESEITLMNNYVKMYAGEEHSDPATRVPFENILDKYWAEEKYPLYKAFGKKLIVSKPINCAINAENVKEELFNSAEYIAFFEEAKRIRRSSTLSSDSWVPMPWGGTYHPITVITDYLLGDPKEIADNIYYAKEDDWTLEVPTLDGKTIKIKPGEKLFKAIGKIANAYNLTTFENFRIAHSRILNNAKYSGELYLSIHPMDFMTMSDNANQWSSCMSWTNRGCYRRGTVEMMNSPYAVVAYLKSSSPFYCADSTWNNKRWRSLVLSCPGVCTTAIKSYPYPWDEVSAEAVQFLAELTNENCGTDFVIENMANMVYEDEDLYGVDDSSLHYSIEFETQTMYNDFHAEDIIHPVIPSLKYLNHPFHISVEYSGQEQCVWCGSEVMSAYWGQKYDEEVFIPEMLVCSDCGAPNAYCPECYNHYHAVEGKEYVVDDTTICPNCYEYRTALDLFTGERHLCTNMRSVIVFADGTTPGGRAFNRYAPCYVYSSIEEIRKNSHIIHSHSDIWGERFYMYESDLSNEMYYNEERLLSQIRDQENQLSMWF